MYSDTIQAIFIQYSGFTQIAFRYYQGCIMQYVGSIQTVGKQCSGCIQVEFWHYVGEVFRLYPAGAIQVVSDSI